MKNTYRYHAVVDLRESVIWIQYETITIKYDLSMLAAATRNNKYWNDAELGMEPHGMTREDILEGRNKV
jgi:hypothetical protein